MAPSIRVASPFKKLSGKDTYRIVFVSSGPDKSGKNHFGYGMPGPIYGFYLDPNGHEGVAEKFIRGDVEGFKPKDIYAATYQFRKDKQGQDEAAKIRDAFEADLETALASDCRSIQVDETELWEVYRFAEYGRESTKGIFMGPLNRRYAGWIQRAYDAGKNVQLIQKVKTKWEDDKPTDQWTPRGFQDSKYYTQLNLEHLFVREGDDRQFIIDVGTCRQNMNLYGERYVNTTFPEVAQAVFPGSDESDWT